MRRRRIRQLSGLCHGLLLPCRVRTRLGVGGIEVVAVAWCHSRLKIRGISSALAMHSHRLPFSIDIGLRLCHGGVCTVAAGGYGSRCLRHSASSTLGGGRVGDVETGLLFALFIDNPAVGEEQFRLLGAILSPFTRREPFCLLGYRHMSGILHSVQRLHANGMNLLGRHLVLAVAQADRDRRSHTLQRRFPNLLGRIGRHDVAARRHLGVDVVGGASAWTTHPPTICKSLLGLGALLEPVHVEPLKKRPGYRFNIPVQAASELTLRGAEHLAMCLPGNLLPNPDKTKKYNSPDNYVS
ncbi:hypothetical protein AM433_002253 [Pseudomonas aeruginosa]|nr:hypothetical protein AM433_002253 [Pseudomonas aeruginosa]